MSDATHAGSEAANKSETVTLPPVAAGAETLPGAPVLADPALPPELADHPRYLVQRLLGRGGMGAVYQAVHRVMERPVALKVMRPDLIDNPAAVDRFRREVKAAAQLVHPNIVTAFDAEQVGAVHFLVMEYVAGRNLAEVVEATGPLPLARAASFIRQAARGLQHACDKGMIHRDIKPHNLILTNAPESHDPEVREHGQVKILDFGLARFASEEGGGPQTASGVIMGTVDFMAPEQADSARKADIRSDIYSLGCTLYYLLAGRAVFPDGTVIQRVMSHVEKPPPSLTTFRGDLPPEFHPVLAKMLAKDPAKRFQTPAEVAAALAPFLAANSDVILTVEAVEVQPADVTEVEPPTPIVATRRAKSTPPTPAPIPAPRRGPRVLLGCFLLALVAIVGTIGAGVYLVREAFTGIGNFATKQISDIKRQGETWEAMEQTFMPPPPDAAQIFPRRLGDFSRVRADDQAAYPPLDISATGYHAEYKAGSRSLHVYVYPANSLMKEGIYGRVLNRVSPPKTPGMKATADGITSVSGSPQSSRVSYRRGAENGSFWWHADWLFFVRSAPPDDPTDLLQQFVKEQVLREWKP